MKFRQKKGWLIRDFVIAGLIMGMIIGLLVLSIADINNNYLNVPGVNHDVVSADFASHYSTLSNTLDKANSMTKSVQGEGGFSLVGAFDVVFNSAFTTIALVWDTILIYTGMATNIPQDFNFLANAPITIFFSTLIAIVTIYLVFVWLSSVTRGKI